MTLVQVNARKMALDVRVGHGKSNALGGIHYPRCLSVRVVLSWISRLCDAYLGSAVLLKCSGAYCPFVAQPGRFPHVSPARCALRTNRGKGLRGSRGGERKTMHHPRAVMPGRISAICRGPQASSAIGTTLVDVRGPRR